MYHRIDRDPFDPWGTVVDPAKFAEHLSWLSKSRTVLPLSEFAERHRQRELPPDAVAITLDDGYACNAHLAAPLLERFGAPATIFLPFETIESGRPFWWDEVEEIVFESDADSLRVHEREIALGEKRSDDRHWQAGAAPRTPRQVAFRRVWDALWERPSDLQQSVDNLTDQISHAPRSPAKKRPMTPEEVRTLAASPSIEIGSHTLTHPWLASLASAERAHEISGSVGRGEELAGRRPKALAYPFGNFDAECERLAEEAGFICACSTEDKPVTASSRLSALPRMQVGNWTVARFRRAMASL